MREAQVKAPRGFRGLRELYDVTEECRACPLPTPHAPALARRPLVVILDFLLFSASFVAVFTTHANGSPPFDSTPRGDHFEPSPTHFGQGSGDRLPLLAANCRSSSSLHRSCDRHRHHHHQN
ncbi:hypothetical protein Salat_0844100 [Sesamum alatum]|uniref:Uncharacterized protein n=1 Tax=Sesamum alatum TaxID=300844 RepID=A0AAE1YIM0_9LAMI|nr:hypothetical protein Salat_0844100 [Sesamum alatum]